MYIGDFLDRLYFDNYATLHEEVDAIARIDPLTVVEYWKHKLPLVVEASFHNFMGKAGFVGAFQ